MTAIWIGLLVAAGATVFMVVTSWRHRIEMAELGSVSAQWLAEQRANDRHHSER